jgi:hypothetical protein
VSETPRRRDQGEQADAAPGRGPATYPGTPRWVRVAVGLVVLLVVLLVLMTALGLHTPGGPGGHGF